MYIICMHMLIMNAVPACSSKCLVPVVMPTPERLAEAADADTSRGENTSRDGQSAWEQWHSDHSHDYHLRRWGFAHPEARSKQDNATSTKKMKKSIGDDQGLTTSHFIDCLFDHVNA